MKGNEARVVFFIHPVDQLRDGKVSKVKERSTTFVLLSVLLLVLLLAVCLFTSIFGRGYKPQELVKWTKQPIGLPGNLPKQKLEDAVPDPEVREDLIKEIEGYTRGAREKWQFYPLVTSASLLIAYLAFRALKWRFSRVKILEAQTENIPREEKMLLHTLPYYLAITRSSCEVCS